MNPGRLSLTVPGNVLLLGEYAVLEEGGLGVAMAVERRVRIEVHPGEGLRIDGSWPGSALSWTPEAGPAHPLLAAAVAEAQGWLGGKSPAPHRWAARIVIDSSAFFAPDGRKAGLGSSAAVSVGLVCALLAAAGLPMSETGPAVPMLARQAHWRAQGGAGSGYDVTCSFHGGTGIFHGGAAPTWEPARLPGDPSIFLFSGPKPVATSEAVRLYGEWKARNPGPAREFLRASNDAVLRFVHARTGEEAARWFGACRSLGIDLGDAIGAPARLEVPDGLPAESCKAVGAGNELGICLVAENGRAPALSGAVRRMIRAEKGVVWEA